MADLKIDGFRHADLYDPARLEELAHRFYAEVEATDGDLGKTVDSLERTEVEIGPITEEEIIEFCLASPYTRTPLWRGEPENIIGVLHAKDLLRDQFLHLHIIERTKFSVGLLNMRLLRINILGLSLEM